MIRDREFEVHAIDDGDLIFVLQAEIGCRDLTLKALKLISVGILLAFIHQSLGLELADHLIIFDT